MATTDTLKTKDIERKLDALPDVTDLRDRYYQPALIALEQTSVPDIPECYIRNQFSEGACTGFALAAVIDQQCRHLFGEEAKTIVSTRMLYEMAKLHDDTPGRCYSGSTIRGALKGFFHNGVCLEDDAPFFPQVGQPLESWKLSVNLARKARKITLGAYFRLNHEINDYHTALAEAGALIVSAEVHSGWANPRGGVITPRSRIEGRHAFAIVGYNSEGFIIQNSFGAQWGGYDKKPGLALWRYEDWAAHVTDAWVMRLAISSPDAFNVKFARNHASLRRPQGDNMRTLAPRRQDVNGHFLHIDDGELVRVGRYASTDDAVAATAEFLSDPPASCDEEAAKDKMATYQHAVLIAHGAMQNQFDVAKRIRAWKPVFKRNGIYPIHIIWDTVFNSEINNVIADLLRKARDRMGPDEEQIDAGLETLARPLGRKLWRNLTDSSKMAFGNRSEGAAALSQLLDGTQAHKGGPLKLHFMSNSAGVHLLSSILPLMESKGLVFDTCSLMSPACTALIYERDIKLRVGRTIGRVNQYSLIDKREEADSLDIYRKSLLYLVKNAIAEKCGAQILGMQNDLEGDNAIDLAKDHQVFFAGQDKETDSKTHRGFESDRATMNHILGTILGEKPKPSTMFNAADLTGY